MKLQEGAEDDAAMIVANVATLRGIPHAQLYVQQAEPVARLFDLRRPDFLRIRIVGSTAINEVTPGVISVEETEKMREMVRKLVPEVKS